MAQWQPTQSRQSRPPSLRVDTLRAHRQNQDAVILPIVYELAEPGYGLNSDSWIIPITLPVRRFTTVVTPLETAINELTRKQNLSLLKQKLESPRKRPAKTKTQPSAQQTENTSARPVSTKNKPEGNSSQHLQTTVSLLLLAVIVLVIFAWACFR